MAPWVCNAIRLRIFRKARTPSPLTFQKIRKAYTATPVAPHNPHQFGGKPSTESQVDSESKESLESSLTESRADSESSSESKQLTQSTTSKNLIKALPNLNNVRDSASRAQLQNYAIFAAQKSHKMCSASAHTAPRPLRGVQSLEKGGRSASATIALEADTARHSPRLPKRKSGALFFSGLGRAGRGETPFLFAQTRDSKKN